MSELDEAWAFALAEAEARARLSGRADIAAYLALRKSNDFLRQTGIHWLTETLETLAAHANRSGASIQISKQDAHRFRVGNATMVGSLLTLRSGVRELSVEAGWPRAPKDGFVHGGALARGHIKHLGIKSASETLLLVLSQQGTPRWVLSDKRGKQTGLHEANLRAHIAILIAHR
ncbi:MAG: hypothetical protein ACREBG_06730 [Pyrinomonadaceae bacterium]